MLDGYVSEKEQIEAIRKWWQEYGQFILIAIVIGLTIGFSFRYWHKFERQKAENASIIYQSVLTADGQNKLSTAQGGATLLMRDFSSSPYASLAALLFAKEAVVQHKLSVALTQLKWVADHAKQKRLQQIAHIFSARILLSQGNTKAATAQLQTVQDKDFLPLVNWVKGDIESQEGHAKKAMDHYTQAKDALIGFSPAVDFLNEQLMKPIK